MKVQLANTYDSSKEYDVTSWYATPKLDGVRAVFTPGEGFSSRNGNPLKGFDGLSARMSAICADESLSFCDGEFMLPGHSFQAVQSAVLSRSHNEKNRIEYHVFAVGGDFSNTEAMLEALRRVNDSHIHPICAKKIHNTRTEIDTACREYVSQGYEGVMLRHPLVAFSAGRSDNLLKHKLFLECDLTITDAWEGEGRYEDMIGGVTVEGVVADKKVRCSVGNGFSIEDRYVLFEDEALIGKTMTVKYQSLTEKPDKNGFYSLRFPSSVGVKEDR